MQSLKEEILNYKLRPKDKNKLVCFTKLTTYKTKYSTAKHFLKSELYKKVKEATSFLPNETPSYIRLKAIFKDIHSMEKCPCCNDNKAISNNVGNGDFFRKTCGKKSCMAKIAASIAIKKRTENIEEYRQKMSNSKCAYQEKRRKNEIKLLFSYLDNNYQVLDKSCVISFVKDKVSKQYKNGKILKDSDSITFKDILCNVLAFTAFLDPDINRKQIDERKVYSDFFKWEERFYSLLNGLNAVPKCPFCNDPRKFLSIKKGYQDICSFKCAGEKARLTDGLHSKEEIFQSINSNKYEILKYPEKLDRKNRLVLKCKKCGYISEYRVDCGYLSRLYKNDFLCKGCENTAYNSNGENEIYTFISSIYSKRILRHDRNILHGYELDFYLPEENLAIEFDGLYWHSEERVKWTYHAMKTEICRKKGIKLIHIFEDEWKNKKDIVKSKIKHFLHLSDTTYYGRECITKEIDFKQLKKFCSSNSLYQCNKTSYNLGLFYKEELIAIAGFSKYRYKKQADWELRNFCVKLNFNIPGGFSKLLSFFEQNKHPLNLILFSNKRWEDSIFLQKRGFKLIKIVKPECFYGNIHVSKCFKATSISKLRLLKLLPDYDPSKTVAENMSAAGYSRIWDCGKLVFVKHYAT